MKDEDVEIAVRGASLRSTWQAIGLWRQLDEVEPEAAAEQPTLPTVRDSTKRRGASHCATGGEPCSEDGPSEPVGSVPIVPRGTRKRKPKQVASIIIEPPPLGRGGTPVRWAPPCGSIVVQAEPGYACAQYVSVPPVIGSRGGLLLRAPRIGSAKTDSHARVRSCLFVG